ncbi:DMT family transporter [Pigmentiphaga aceris]|uniref:DMT family transporter n=1 Tax=Pigmentiphaga aceris TaxID=1940612 RepID=A0A5C0B336_9BURK|nr:DMT family transporter [Pigmentiphaga aceris]QEI09002.1 DMT family transporter [Pigmentiphaga aceris]
MTAATSVSSVPHASRATAIAFVALISSMVCLCIGSSFGKTLFPLVGAQGTTTYRLVGASLILLAIWRPWRMPLAKRDAIAIVGYGVVLGVMNLCFYLSLQTIPIGLAIALEFSGPLTLAVILSRRLIDFVWIGFALCGLGLLLPIGDAATNLDPVGVAYALAAGVFWVAYILLGKLAGNTHGGQATSLGITVAALVVLPFGVATAGTSLLNPSLLVAGLAVAILSAALPFSLEMVALKRLPRKTYGILLSMEPAIGALTGVVMLSEHLTRTQWLAIASIIVASIGCTVTARRNQAAPTSTPA